jgi:hypothetical protein
MESIMTPSPIPVPDPHDLRLDITDGRVALIIIVVMVACLIIVFRDRD